MHYRESRHISANNLVGVPKYVDGEGKVIRYKISGKNTCNNLKIEVQRTYGDESWDKLTKAECDKDILIGIRLNIIS